jgi:hypothetical protein
MRSAPMLMTFLLGIALGSLVVRKLADRTERPCSRSHGAGPDRRHQVASL